MSNLSDELSKIPVYERGIIEKIVHLCPGPNNSHPDVLDAMARPTISHTNPLFYEAVDSVQTLLKSTFQTEGGIALPISATGSGGKQALINNLTKPEDDVLVVVNGAFGARIADAAARAGRKVETLDIDYGNIVTQGMLEDKLKAAGDKHRAVFVVHAETSTGAHQLYMKELADTARKHGALLLVDCVTSLGGIPFRMGEWGVAGAYSGTQKCLSAPPGLSPFAMSDEARDFIKSRGQSIESWYFNLGAIVDYFQGLSGARPYHHTPAVNNIWGLDKALRIVHSEGLEARHQRHWDNGKALETALEEMEFTYVTPKKEERLPELHAVIPPHGIDPKKLKENLYKKHNIDVGLTIGRIPGVGLRFGLMGYMSTPDNVKLLVGAIKEELPYSKAA